MPIHPASGNRVAVLFDGENVSNNHAVLVLRLARDHGQPTVRRVYGGAQKVKGWENATGFRLIHSPVARNSADMLLAIQAVDLAHRGNVDSFVIASSDGDFAHLAFFLVERGHAVLGIGEPKTPGTFRAACTIFTDIGESIDDWIALLIGKAGGRHGIKIKDLNALMRRNHAFKIGEHADRTWRA